MSQTTQTHFEKSLIGNLIKHTFVFPYDVDAYAFVDHGWTLWRNFIALWYQHFVWRENMDAVYFPDYNGTGPIHPKAAEPVFTDLEQITKLPCAAAQVTELALKCEISPQHCLVNVDNYTFGEIEHFMDSQDTSHPRYSQVSGLEFPVCSRVGPTTLSQGIANNQTLAYFIGRVYLFLKRLGIDENRLRFTQLPFHEMAPGVADCWVVEIECSSGWVSCAWITHRSKALDYDEKAVENVEILEKKMKMAASLIKLSFYMGRIISCVYEHSFCLGGEENQHCVFRFPPPVAPIKCVIFVTDPNTNQLARSISVKLKAAGVVHELYMSGESMGGLVRTDELGVPFTVVVDSTTSATIRERDSNEQINFALCMEAVKHFVDVVKNLIMGHDTWGELKSRIRHRYSL